MKKKTKKVVVRADVPYDRLKCLLIASYLLGQESGLRGFTYSHPVCVAQRENIISFIFNANL